MQEKTLFVKKIIYLKIENNGIIKFPCWVNLQNIFVVSKNLRPFAGDRLDIYVYLYSRYHLALFN